MLVSFPSPAFFLLPWDTPIPVHYMTAFWWLRVSVTERIRTCQGSCKMPMQVFRIAMPFCRPCSHAGDALSSLHTLLGALGQHDNWFCDVSISHTLVQWHPRPLGVLRPVSLDSNSVWPRPADAHFPSPQWETKPGWSWQLLLRRACSTIYLQAHS